MTKRIALPLVLAAALGLSACTKHTETDNVTVNDSSTNLETPALDTNSTNNGLDNAADTTGNAGETLGNS